MASAEECCETPARWKKRERERESRVWQGASALPGMGELFLGLECTQWPRGEPSTTKTTQHTSLYKHPPSRQQRLLRKQRFRQTVCAWERKGRYWSLFLFVLVFLWFCTKVDI